MISVFRGLVLPRFYWGSAWQGRRGRFCLKTVKRLLHMGRLYLYLTAYYKHIDKYKPRALGYLKQFVKIRNDWFDGHVMKGCYSKQDDSYIGLPEDVLRYLKIGIRKFYKANPKDKVASIGSAPKQYKWYGWSHRAICGFGIGHVVKKDDIVRSSGWIEGCPEYREDEKTKPPVGFIATGYHECRYLAIRFANAVS